MLKVLILAVACFIVADARKLNRFFWDDDSHFDLTKRHSNNDDLCEADVTGTWDTYVKSTGSYGAVKQGLPNIANCKLRKFVDDDDRKTIEKYVECEEEQITVKGSKITIACKAVLTRQK